MDSDGFAQYKARHGSIGYLFEHVLDEQWKVRQNLRFSRQGTDYRDIYYGGVTLDDTTATRSVFAVDETATAFSVDNQAEYKLDRDRVRPRRPVRPDPDKLDRHWVLTLGARQTWVDNRIDDRLNRPELRRQCQHDRGLRVVQ